MSQTVVVVNPAAAGGRVGRDLGALRERIESTLGPCRFEPTTRSGEGVELARRAIEEGATRVLSLGGDGTHHEVVNGILGHPRGEQATFGVLPAGTGGDFRRTLGVWTLDDALHALSRAVRSVDVGRATYTNDLGNSESQWFLNLASCGMSGLVDRLVNASSKRLGGTVSFFLGTLRAMATYEPACVRVVADGRDLGEHQISVVLLGNGQYAGGGMHFCPEASLTDGALDLVILPHSGMARSLLRTHHLYRGTLAKVPGAMVLQARSVTVEVVSGTAYLDLDGESPGRAPVTFCVEPSRLRLFGAPG